MAKLNVCVLFGGMSPEHAVSLRSAESVLNHMDKEKYNIFPVGITMDGDWILYGSTDYSKLPKEARDYVDFIESHLAIPITIVSTGPGRHEIARRC